ncbi:hypothetical protein NMY22_g4175 [Coprinellus aureogranulatus]|nr:hypothetical protein NMY22_g4175 [Coprinellus aureogranulatus]
MSSVLPLNRVITVDGETCMQPVTVRVFNQYYVMHSISSSLESIGSKVRDSTYVVISTMRPNELVDCHRYIFGKDLRTLCSYHGIPVFNATVPSLRARLASHSVCGPSCKNAFFVFKLLPQPRQHVDMKFQHSAMFIPATVALNTSPENSRPWSLKGFPDRRSYKEGDFSHLSPPSLDLKEAIIGEWQDAMSPEKLRRSPCAVCAKLVAYGSIETVNAADLNLSLLRNEQLPIEVCPTEYNFYLYDRAILHVGGMHDRERLGLLDICEPCGRDLSNNRMPKFAVCNWLYYGRSSLPLNVRMAFQEASIFERVLISRARCNVLSCRFSTAETRESETVLKEAGHRTEPIANDRGNSFRHSRKGMKGNVVVTPMDVLRLNAYLPPSPETIRDTLCIVFTGSEQVVTKELLTSRKLHPVLVRKSRVKLLIHFLMNHNSHYGKVSGFKGFSSEHLDGLFQGLGDQGVPDRVEIAQIRESDASKALTTGLEPGIEEGFIPSDIKDSDALMMENVGYTMSDRTPHAYDQMKLSAVQRCLEQKPFLNLRRGSAILPDFSNPFILSWLLPHLDPWGVGGFYHPLRSRYISMEEQLAHMLQMDDDTFVKDPEFAFIFYNVIRKKGVSQSLRFSAPVSKYRHIVDNILKVDRVQLVQLADKFKVDPVYWPVGEAELKITRLLRAIGTSTGGVPGSAAQKILMRNQIRAMITAYGSPTLFITLTPSDRDNLLVQVLSSTERGVGSLLGGEILGDWQRNLLATRNPGACALFFHHSIKAFIEIILRHGRESGGLYGECKAYYGTVEAQGRGTLHCHMLIWLAGHPSPAVLQDLLLQSDTYKEKLFRWLESVMNSDFLGEDGRRQGSAAWDRRMERKMRGTGPIHPGAVIGPLLKNYSRARFWEEYTMYVNQLLVEYHIHEHRLTCWKYLARGEKGTDANCRLGINGETVSESSVDPVSLAITIRRTHPRMTHFTDLITFLMKCNSDIKFIGSGSEAKAFMYYVTDYVTKPTLTMHVGLFALSYAIKRIEGRLKESSAMVSTLPDEKVVSAMTTAVNSMMGHQEISHPQVMSYLVGGGDHYTSESFCSFNWGSIHAYMLSYWFPVDTINSTADENVSLSMFGGEVMVSSQRLDYMYRCNEPPYNDLCLYDFIAMVRKVPSSGRGLIDEEFSNLIPEEEESVRVPRAVFSSPEHPQFRTHCLRSRRKACIPVLLGPNILCSRTDTENDMRSMQVLTLFKPWRTAQDLKSPTESWTDALDHLLTKISLHHRTILSNFDALAESKEERDKNLQRRRQNKRSRAYDPRQILADVVAEIAETGEFDVHAIQREGTVYNALLSVPVDGATCYSNESLDRLSQLIGPVCAAEFDRCYPALSELNLVRESVVEGSVFPSLADGMPAGGMDTDDIQSHIKYVAGMRLNHITSVLNLNVPVSGVSGDQMSSSRRTLSPQVSVDQVSESSSTFAPQNIGFSSHSLFRVMDGTADLDWKWACVVGVIRDKGLYSNCEQLRAFLIAARHIVEGGNQLLMHISGMGGSGKSHVVQSISLLLHQLGRRNELLIGAPTGIAAVLIGGATLHSLILASSGKRPGISQKLSDIWKPVRYLIIDEISMVGATMLAMISSRIRIAKGDDPLNSSRLFGGVNVIALGDFCQLKPVNQHSLFASSLVENPSFAQASDNHGLDAIVGAYIWRQFRTVVLLRQNNRQKSDPVYGAVLTNIRSRYWANPISDRVWTEMMYMEYLQSRLISRVAKESPVELAGFADAPVVVGHRILRDAINVKLIQYHSMRERREVHLYYSQDAISGQPVKGNLCEVLLSLSSTKCGDMLGRLPLFIGMRVMILENLAISNGIVNGAEGCITDVKWHLDGEGHRIADAVYVHVPGSQVCVPGLDPDVVVVGP